MCNNLLCSTVNIYTKYGINMQYKVLIFKWLQRFSL